MGYASAAEANLTQCPKLVDQHNKQAARFLAICCLFSLAVRINRFQKNTAQLYRSLTGSPSMTRRCVGLVVVGETVTVVDTEVPDDKDSPTTILSDATWSLQKGDRAPALSVLHQRCADYFRENEVDLVIVKASALPTGSVKLAVLGSAEVRGVVIAAAASSTEVAILSKALISRTYGERKVDEYLKDDSFWAEHTEGGKLRKTSREAAMLVIAARNR